MSRGFCLFAFLSFFCSVLSCSLHHSLLCCMGYYNQSKKQYKCMIFLCVSGRRKMAGSSEQSYTDFLFFFFKGEVIISKHYICAFHKDHRSGKINVWYTEKNAHVGLDEKLRCGPSFPSCTVEASTAVNVYWIGSNGGSYSEWIASFHHRLYSHTVQCYI